VKEYEKTTTLLSQVGAGDLEIEKITAVYNPTLVESFTSRLAILKTRFTESAGIFLKQDWKKNDPKKEREKTFGFYENYLNSFAWNKGQPVPVVPVVTIGTEKEIDDLCKYGFSVTGHQATYGVFGQGIYVATSPSITHPNGEKVEEKQGEKEGEEDEKEEKKKVEGEKKVVLISYAIAGNAFPIIAGDLKKEKPLVGNPVKNGYNSHVALVDPLTGNIVEDLDGDHVAEFVIEQKSQLTPAFVIRVK